MELSYSNGAWMDEGMKQALEQRRIKGNLRRLPDENQDSSRWEPYLQHYSTVSEGDNDVRVLDFSSNDYLGLAHDQEQHDLCKRVMSGLSTTQLGATGSRLLSGDSGLFHQLEQYLAVVHRRPAALLCNSGYDANLSLVSSLKCTHIVYDEYIHNSLHMGIRLWQTSSQLANKPSTRTCSFSHNSSSDLRQQLERLSAQRVNQVVVLVESVYSMDGDVAPLREMLNVCGEFGAKLIVDEAHGLGIYGQNRSGAMDGSVTGTFIGGTGVIARDDLEDHPALFCSVHTFGKAAGCHGAVICGSETLKQYLVNYAYPFIYSTALPVHSLVTIKCAYETMTGPKGEALRQHLFHLVNVFRHSLQDHLYKIKAKHQAALGRTVYLLPSTSPIQALMIPGNEVCTKFCNVLFQKARRRERPRYHIRLFPIKSPTVPAGQERIRIVLHANNTVEEVETLVLLIMETLDEMDRISYPSHSRL